MSTRPPRLDDVVAGKKLSRALDFISVEARQWVLDALACRLHNEGHALQGNTERSDARWFAREIWAELNPYEDRAGLDKQPAGLQEQYLKIANACIKRLPQLTERIAQRYITLSTAMRSEEEILRAARAAARTPEP